MQNTTAKLFANGKSQAVRLPKEFRFSGTEVGIRKVGDIVYLFPPDSAWAAFLNAPAASDDFGDAILEARKNKVPNAPRESL